MAFAEAAKPVLYLHDCWGIALKRLNLFGFFTGAELPRLLLHTLLVSFALTACTPHYAAKYAAPVPEAKLEPIYVVTQRELDRTGTIFGQPRPKGMNYFRNVISIPPTHVVGQIEWPEQGEQANAARHFAIVDTEIYDGMASMRSALRRDYGAGREKLLFVHGYNNTLSDAMYRLAQIKADFDLKMPTVLFSWASAGDARGYVYDRDSVLYARDDLKRTLDQLTAQPGDKVLLMAHSMGSQLTMEVLRQAAIAGDRQLLSQISGVVLMAPDIDPELFRRQAEAIGHLPQPFIIFASRQDRALGLVGLLTGRKPRLGVIDSPEKVKGLDVTVVDFTALGRKGGLNHDVPTSSPMAVRLLTGMIQQAKSRESTFDRYMVLGPQSCLGDVPGGPRLPITGLPVPGAC